MTTDYNDLAGRNLSRLAALSDGIFAVAMTLLVFDLKPPAGPGVATDADLMWALLGAGWQLVVLALSFMTLGIFWVAQGTQYHYLARTDRHFTWVQLAYLFVVTLVPFATRVVVEFPDSRLAIVLYWLPILLMGGLLLWGWEHAERAGLVAPNTPPTAGAAFRGRVRLAQGLYSLALALCLIRPRLSLWGFLLIQFGFVFRIRLPFPRARPPAPADGPDRN